MGRWSTRLTTEQCKSISTFFLRRHGYFTGGVRSGGVSWSRGGETTGSIGFNVSMMRRGEEYIRFRYSRTDFEGNRATLDYKVELTPTACHFGGVRWWFICPLVVNGRSCGRRVGVLYLGGGKYFGCRYCYGLTYESSRDSHKFDRLFGVMGLTARQGSRLLKTSK